MRYTATMRNLRKIFDDKTFDSLLKNAQFAPSPLSIQKFVEFGQV